MFQLISDRRLPWCCGADAELIGERAFDRLQAKAKQVRELHVVNISSTYYGGGVAELLSSMTLLMNHLVTRLVKEYLDLFASFRPSFRLVQQP